MALDFQHSHPERTSKTNNSGQRCTKLYVSNNQQTYNLFNRCSILVWNHYNIPYFMGLTWINMQSNNVGKQCSTNMKHPNLLLLFPTLIQVSWNSQADRRWWRSVASHLPEGLRKRDQRVRKILATVLRLKPTRNWSEIGCHMYKTRINWWFDPLWKIWVRQLGWLFHVCIYIWKFIKIHVPNHQAVKRFDA